MLHCYDILSRSRTMILRRSTLEFYFIPSIVLLFIENTHGQYRVHTRNVQIVHRCCVLPFTRIAGMQSIKMGPVIKYRENAIKRLFYRCKVCITTVTHKDAYICKDILSIIRSHAFHQEMFDRTMIVANLIHFLPRWDKHPDVAQERSHGKHSTVGTCRTFGILCVYFMLELSTGWVYNTVSSICLREVMSIVYDTISQY